MHTRFRHRRIAIALSALGGLSAGTPALGAILQVDATVTAQVQQFIGGQEGSLDSAFEEFNATTATLPIEVAAELRPPEGAASNGFVAAAFADFRDPTLSTSRNPQEFGLETGAYTPEPDISFSSQAVATETRRVAFSSTDLNLGLGETQRQVFSSVFVSGAAIVWSPAPARDLTGLSVRLHVTVERLEAENEPVVVFDGLLTAAGGPDGTLTVDSPDGIQFELGGPELLSAADGSTAETLQQELAALGDVQVLLVPDQELSYSYAAQPDVEFQLRATLESEVVSLPGGTGLDAVFGRTFETLAGLIADSTASFAKGEATQAALNAAILAGRTRVEPDEATLATPRGPLCGALGGGTLGLSLAFLLTVAAARRLR